MIPTNSQDPKESISAFKILEDHAKAGPHFENPAILKKIAINHSTTALKKESSWNVSMETGYSDKSNDQGSFNFENWNQLIDMDITVPHPPRQDHEANIKEFIANFPRENQLSVTASNDPVIVASFKQEQNLATPGTNNLNQNYRNNSSNFSHKAAYDMSYAQENSQFAHGSNSNRSNNNVTSDSENNNLLEILNLPTPQTEEEAYLLEEYFKYKQQWYNENNNTASAAVSNAPVEMAEESLNDGITSAEEANALVLQNTLNIVPNDHVHTDSSYNFRNLRDHNNPLIQAQLAAQGTTMDSQFMNNNNTNAHNFHSNGTSSNSNSSINIAHNYNSSNSSGVSGNNNSSNNSIVGNIPLEFLYDLPPNIPPIPKKVNQNFTNLPSTDNRTVPTLSAELAAQVLAATQSPKELNHQKEIKTNKLISARPTVHDNITQQQLLKKNTYSSGNNSNNSSNNSSSNSIGVHLPHGDTRLVKGYTPPVVDSHSKLPNPGNTNNNQIKPPLPLPSHVMHNNLNKINNNRPNTSGGMSTTVGNSAINNRFSDNMFHDSQYFSAPPVPTPPHPALPKHVLANQQMQNNPNSTNSSNNSGFHSANSGFYNAHNSLSMSNTPMSQSYTNNNSNISTVNNNSNNANTSTNNNRNSNSFNHNNNSEYDNSINQYEPKVGGYYNNSNRNLHTNSGSGNNSSNGSVTTDAYHTAISSNNSIAALSAGYNTHGSTDGVFSSDRYNYNNNTNNNNSSNYIVNSKNSISYGSGSGSGGSSNNNSGWSENVPGAQHSDYVYLVDFKKRRLEFFLSAECTDKVEVGDVVIVTADRGDDLGVLVEVVSCRDYMIRNKNKTNVNGVVLRLAYPNEINSIPQKLKDEDQVTEFARNLAHNIYHLNIQILDSEYQFDRHKLTIYYDAAGRTDFRDFVKAMYITFKARIWMERLPAERGYFSGR